MMEVYDVARLAALSGLDCQVVDWTKKVWEAKYSIWSSHNIYFRELVDEHKLMHGESSLKSVNLVLRDPPIMSEAAARTAVLTMKS